MAKIITKGTGKRDVEYDSVTVTISFKNKKRQMRDAIKTATEECEDFLRTMKGTGFDIGRIRAGENKVDRREYSEDKNVMADRTISFKANYDLELIDMIMKIIEKGSYSVNVNFDPYVSNLETLHKELKTEAVEDARGKAELMANALDLCIVGVERIKMEQYDYKIFENESERMERMEGFNTGEVGDISLLDDVSGLFTGLKPELTSEEESVYVEWILE